MKNIPRILVLDDDANLRKTLSDILRLKGYEVAAAGTGAEGIAEAERAFVNVALIDLKLPDMSGIEVMGRIKRATPRTEAIILTGHASLDTAVEATNKGAFSYLLKPYEIDRLLRHIQRAVDRQQTQQEILRLASFPTLNPNPVLELNAAGEITYLNPAAERLFPELAVAQPAPGALGDISASAVAGSGEQQEVAREVRVGNTTFEQFLYPVPQSDLIRIYMLDISERKRSEQALRESEETFRAVSSSAQDAILMLDNDGKIALWNAAAEKVFGYSSEEALGKELHLLLIPARFREAHRTGFGRFRSTGEGAAVGKTLELVALRKDGTEFPLELSLSAFRLKDKWHAVGIVRDITERKKSEEGLKLFRALVDQSTDAIEVLDPETLRFLDVNQKTCLDLGYSREELLSLSAFDINSTLDRSRATEFTQGLRKLGSMVIEGRHRRKDGSELPVEVSLGYVQLDRAYIISVARDITERKRTEDALREDQARLNLALRSAGMGVWHLDIIENRRYFDDQVCRLLGIDPATFTGAAEEFFGAVHPDDRETIKAALARTKEQDVPYERDFRAVWPDGSVRYLTSRGRLVRDDKGRPARISGIAWDITERKKSEEGLKLFRALVDQSTDAIEVLDPETLRFLDVNQKTCLDLGYSREELLSLSAFDIDPMLDRSRSTEIIQQVRKLGSLIIEGCHRRKDGSEFPVEVSLGYVQLDRAYIISIARDITERKLAQEALARKERYYRKIIEGGSEVFFLMDRAGTLLYRNESGKQLTGWETAEVLGKPVTDFVSAESLPLVRNAMAEAFAKPDQLIRVEVRMLRKDGTQVEIEALAKNLLDDPDIAGIVVTARDITERKQAEAKLAEQFNELQRWNEATQGREMRILDLKHEVNELLGQAGLPLRYPSAESDGQKEA